MAGLQSKEGAVAPLFDRLRQQATLPEAQPLQALDREELQDSVRRELTRLFNVRSLTPAARFAEAQLTVVDYGIPDFTAFSPGNPDDRARLARLLTRAIAAFEPRLKAAVVALEAVEGDPRALRVRVDAGLVVGSLLAPITLAVVVPGAGSRNQLLEVVVLTPVEP